MIIRIETEQTEHDLIVKEAAKILEATGKYKVFTNPGQEHNVAVGGFYPDIIITNKDSETVRFVIEVETISSIKESEVSQWRDYAKLGATFYLLVPYSNLETAKRLCAEGKVTASFGYYWRDEQNKINISYENSK